MKIMTKEIEKVLEKYPIYSQDGLMGDAKLITYFFDPMSNWTWYVTEGERREDGDWEFFGLVHGLEWEWGYFLLSDLCTKIPGRLPIEREIWTQPLKHTVRELAGMCGCPEHLLIPHKETVEGFLETITIDARAESQPETVTVEWTAAGYGQQTLF